MLRDVIVRLALSGVGVVVGLGCFVLFVCYGNPYAAFWSVLASALASVCFHLHWVKGKDSLADWHTSVTLCTIACIGFAGGVAGFIALIYYRTIFRFFRNNPASITAPIAENSFISPVWAFICCYWGFALLKYSLKYYEIAIKDQITVSSILVQDSV